MPVIHLAELEEALHGWFTFTEDEDTVELSCRRCPTVYRYSAHGVTRKTLLLDAARHVRFNHSADAPHV